MVQFEPILTLDSFLQLRESHMNPRLLSRCPPVLGSPKLLTQLLRLGRAATKIIKMMSGHKLKAL